MPRRDTVLIVLLCLQGLAALFFLMDGIEDILGLRDPALESFTDRFEYLIAFALLISTVFTANELVRTMRRNRHLSDQIRAASGEFAELLEEWFSRWGLTPSERDVALLTIKGLSNSEIAAIRETREGTIKAHSNAIYRKAGVSGRPQLLSLFIEELMNGVARPKVADDNKKGGPTDRPASAN